MITYLVELLPALKTTGAVQVLRYSSDPGWTRANDVEWLPRLSEPYTRTFQAFDGAFSDQPQQFGSIGVRMQTGDLVSPVTGMAWDGRRARIWRGQRGQDTGQMELLFDGECDTVEATKKGFTVKLRGPGYALTRNMLSLYSGSGDADGTGDLANTPRPMVLGQVLNAAPVYVDRARGVFQYHGYGPGQLWGVFDGGSALQYSGTNHATYAALKAASPAPGYYDTCNLLGMGRHGGEPITVLTVDASADATASGKIGTILQYLGTLAGCAVDAPTMGWLDANLTHAQDNYVSEQTTYEAVAKDMMLKLGGYLVWTASGAMSAGLVRRGAAPTLALGRGNILPTPTIRATAPPFYRRRMGYQRAWSVQTFAEVRTPREVAPRGTYSSGTTYAYYDLVAFGADTWLHIGQDPTRGVDPAEGDVWTKFGYGVSKTSELTDDARLGLTASWPSVSDDGSGKRPKDYADETARNTASSISNQGSLATKNAADYGSDVTGTGKPDTYRVMARGNAVGGNVPSGYVQGLTRGDGGNVWGFYARSYSVLWYNRTTKVWAGRNFDIYGSSVDYGFGTGDGGTGPTAMATHLNNIPPGSPVVVYSSDEPRANRLNGPLPAAMYRCGASRSRYGAGNWKSHGAYVLVGMAGAGEGNASAEMYWDGGADGSNQSIVIASFSMVDGRIQAGSRALNSADELLYNGGGTVGAKEPQEKGANVTENRVASSFYLQGSLATLSSLSRTGGYLTDFGNLAGLGNIMFGDDYLLEKAGVKASLDNFKTSLGTALGILNQAWAATSGSQDRTDNQRVAVGGNGLVDTEFMQGTTLWPPIWGGNPAGQGVQRGVNYANSTDNYYGANSVIWASVPGATTAGNSIELCASGSEVRYWVPVKPGDNVYVAALLARHRCQGQVNVHWVDTKGAYQGENAWDGGRSGGGKDGLPANFDLVGGFIPANPNAAFACLRIRMKHTGENDPFLFMMRPQITVCPAGQVTPPPYVPGRPDVRADRTGANVALGFLNQGSLATLSSLSRTSGYLTGFGNLAGEGNIVFGDQYLLEVAGVRATKANFKTSEGTASGISNQGALATKSTIGADTDLSGTLANRLKPYAGDANYLRASQLAWDEGGRVQDMKPAEAGANITENRTASSISNQSAFATAPELTRSNLFNSYFNASTFSLNYTITRSNGTETLTESLAVTSLGIASGISNQGGLATKDSVGTGQINANSIAVPGWVNFPMGGSMASYTQNVWTDFDNANGGSGGTGGGSGGGGGGVRPGTVNLQ